MGKLECGFAGGLVMDAHEAVRRFVPRRATIATGGMSGSGVPKEFMCALAERVEREGGDFSFTLLTGGATSEGYEECVSRIARHFAARYPFLSGGLHRKMANEGSLRFFDYGLFRFNRLVRSGFFGEIDVAVFEATAITGECAVVPSTSLDATLSFLRAAKRVIVELNTAKPPLEGIHDTYVPDGVGSIPVGAVLDRPGEVYVRLPKEKLVAVVPTEASEGVPASYRQPSTMEAKLAEKILELLTSLAPKAAWDGGEPVVQPGAGPLSSALADALKSSGLRVSVWAETIPVKWCFLVGDAVGGVSASALYTLGGEQQHMGRFYSEFRDLAPHVVLRGQEVTNNPEVIQRLRLVSIQQALEVDVFGNANTSHIGGGIYNGVGGSVDFPPAAMLTIVALPSTTSDGKTSRIVPFTSHVDVPEHYVDVVVTEQGVADLRGLSPMERARRIVESCAHPAFRDPLLRYLEGVAGRGHEPRDQRLFEELFGGGSA